MQGLALSKAIAGAGGNVAILYRSSASAPEAAASLAKDYNIKTKAYQCDVTDQARVNQVFEEVVKDFGQIHGVVANAGVAIVRPALDIGKDEFDCESRSSR